MNRQLITYFENEDGYRWYNGESFIDSLDPPKFQDGQTLNSVHKLHKSMEQNDETLIYYYNNLNQWSKQLGKLLKDVYDSEPLNIKANRKMTNLFNYLDKPGQVIAVKDFFYLFVRGVKDGFSTEGKQRKKLNELHPITWTESKWIERTYNSGHQYYDKTKVNEFNNVTSFDMNSAYQECLGNPDYDFKIPKSQGKERILTQLPQKFKDLKYGIYHVKITSDNPDASKIFQFNKEHYYNYYDLRIYYKYKSSRLNVNGDDYQTFRFNVELILDGEPNALIYDDEDLIKCSDIFNKSKNEGYENFYWYPILKQLKERHPENKLCKFLGSMLWGIVSEFNQIMVHESKMKDYKKADGWQIIRSKDFGDIGTDSANTIYYLTNINEDPYKTNLRLKGFINSYCRYKMACHTKPHLNSIIRIHTDSVSFINPEIKLDESVFKLEDKSSGYIKFVNCNNYFHKCSECKNEYKFTQSKSNKLCKTCKYQKK